MKNNTLSMGLLFASAVLAFSGCASIEPRIPAATPANTTADGLVRLDSTRSTCGPDSTC